MKIRYIILTVILFIFITPNVNADICGSADILRVKESANKVTIDHEYIQNEDTINGLFNIKITGITEDMYIHEESTNRTYTSSSNVDGVITMPKVEGNNFIFRIYYERCDSKLVRTIKYNLPKYNYYAESELCVGISKEELEVCDPWYQGELDDETFQKAIDLYLKKIEEQKKQEEKENTIFKKIIDFLLNYYIYIIVAIALITIIILFITIRRKRYSLD